MQAHQQRVVDEKSDLDVKIEALSKFIGGSAIFDNLPEDEKGRLRDQLDAMTLYSNILGKRVAAF